MVEKIERRIVWYRVCALIAFSSNRKLNWIFILEYILHNLKEKNSEFKTNLVKRPFLHVSLVIALVTLSCNRLVFVK